MLLLIPIFSLNGLSYRANLELAGRLHYIEDDNEFGFGIHIIPMFSASLPAGSYNLDARLRPYFRIDDDGELDAEIYRFWLRFSGVQNELRLGRQQLNFGPAQILRSLRWFDQLDPNDFLGHTRGVDGLLYRHFIGNSTLWVWGLLGDEREKGLEIYPSGDDKPEFGGRLDFPLLGNYWGLTAHYRPEVVSPVGNTLSESRFALDGRWDIFIGIWFEAVQSFYRGAEEFETDFTYLTAGLDYTLAGIYLTGEHMLISPHNLSDKDLYADRIGQTSVLSASYNLDLLNSLSGSIYYEHIGNDPSLILSWERVYDNLSFKFDLFQFESPAAESSIYSGRGAALTIKYNL